MKPIFHPVSLDPQARLGSFTQNFVTAIICDILNNATTPPVPPAPPGAKVWIVAALDPNHLSKSANRSRALAPDWIDRKALYEGLSETGCLVEASHGRTERLASLAHKYCVFDKQDLVVSLFDFDGAPFDCYWRNLQKFASHWRYAILASIREE